MKSGANRITCTIGIVVIVSVDKDSYPHDSNNQCIILRLQLSFAMINVQLMLV